MPKEDRKKELDALLNTPPEDEEEETDEEETDEEDEEKDDDDEETEEGEDEEIDEEESDDGKKDDEEDQDEEEAEEDAEGEVSKKDRWHGKSREEVIKAYEELEKKNPKGKTEKKPSPKKEGEDEEEDEIKVPTDEELAKMTPKDFAAWMIKNVRDMVSKTYESRSKVRDAVTTEIREAQKDHPLLKTNAEYRELVLALIDTAAQKGVVMPLKEACEKVDSFSGKVKGDTKVSDEEKTRLKKAKAQVERGAGGAPASGDEPDKEKAKVEKIFGQGAPKTPLGGLGF
jgi:hypothetical protein